MVSEPYPATAPEPRRWNSLSAMAALLQLSMFCTAAIIAVLFSNMVTTIDGLQGSFMPPTILSTPLPTPKYLQDHSRFSYTARFAPIFSHLCFQELATAAPSRLDSTYNAASFSTGPSTICALGRCLTATSDSINGNSITAADILEAALDLAVFKNTISHTSAVPIMAQRTAYTRSQRASKTAASPRYEEMAELRKKVSATVDKDELTIEALNLLNDEHHLQGLEGVDTRLRLFQFGLLDYNSFVTAVTGCTGVFHLSIVYKNVNSTRSAKKTTFPADADYVKNQIVLQRIRGTRDVSGKFALLVEDLSPRGEATSLEEYIVAPDSEVTTPMEAIRDYIKLYEPNKGVARVCCSLLSKSARSDANKSASVEKGDMDRLTKLSERVAEDPSVLQEFMSIITVLSLRSLDNAGRAVEAGAGDRAIQAMHKLPVAQTRILHSVPANRPILEDKDFL